MSSTDSGARLRDRLSVLDRNKWLVAITIVLVPLVAILASRLQPHLYRASSEVLLSNQNLAAGLLGIPDTASNQAPDRFAQTQADLASVPTVAGRALKAARVSEPVGDFLSNATVSPQPNSDLLEFSVTNGDPVLAGRLATAWAKAFANYRRELDTGAINNALSDVQAQISSLAANGETKSGLYTSLVNKQQQLKTLETLSTARAQVVREATGAIQVQPRPIRNAGLGLALGIILGIGFAFVREALDTRAHTATEVGDELQLPLLGRLPRPPRRLERADRLTMLSEPFAVGAEPFRIFRTNFDFAAQMVSNGDIAPTVMATSAGGGEGKTTTIANLAVALALTGRNVVLVDFDFRRPQIDRFFKIAGRPTVQDVARGSVPIERALTAVPLPGQMGNGRAAAPSTGQGGSLSVLPAGPPSASLGEFTGSRIAERILDALRKQGDIVLIDAPPLLQVADAVALCGKVDAVFVVSRLNLVRRSMLSEVSRILAGASAAKLGYVLTDSSRDVSYIYEPYNG